MGVKSLFKQSFVKNTVRIVPFKHLIVKKEKTAIDVSCELYVMFGRCNPSEQDQRNALIFEHFGSFCKKLRELNYATVAFVLDGKVPLHKVIERSIRVKNKQRTQDSIIELTRELNEIQSVRETLTNVQEHGTEEEKALDLYGVNLFIDDLEDECVFVRLVIVDRVKEIVLEEEEIQELIKKKIKQNINVRPADTECCKDVLSHYGFPVICSQYETDSQISILIRRGFLTACQTRDSDLLWCLPRGRVYKFSFSDVVEYGENASCQCFSIEAMLSELGWTSEKFIEYCFMVGTDFRRTGLKMIGHVAALKVINQYGSIAGYIAHLEKQSKDAELEYQELLDKQRIKLEATIEKHDINSETNQKKLAAKAKSKRKTVKTPAASLGCNPTMITRLQTAQFKARTKQELIVQKCKLKHQEAIDFYEWFRFVLPVVMEYHKDENCPDIDWVINTDDGDM